VKHKRIPRCCASGNGRQQHPDALDCLQYLDIGIHSRQPSTFNVEDIANCTAYLRLYKDVLESSYKKDTRSFCLVSSSQEQELES
jgi:hypothetical protein